MKRGLFIIASSEVSSNLQRYDGIRYGFRAKDVKNLEDVYVRLRSEGFNDEVKRRIYVRNILFFCWFIRCIILKLISGLNKDAKLEREIYFD